MHSLIAGTIAECGRLDILINNAGIQKPSPSHLIAMEDFDHVLNVNLRGTFLCCREAIRHFLSRPAAASSLTTPASTKSSRSPAYLPYSISKSGLEGLTKTLALEYADRGIRVNSVDPAPPSRPSTAHGSTTRPRANLWKAIFQWGAPRPPPRSQRYSPSSRQTTHRTSQARPSSPAAGSHYFRNFAPTGHPDRAAAIVNWSTGNRKPARRHYCNDVGFSDPGGLDGQAGSGGR